MPNDPTFKIVHDRYAIRIKETLPKLVDGPLMDPRSIFDVLAQVESVVVPLRLYKENRISLSGVLHRNVTILLGLGRSLSTYALSPSGRWSAYHLKAGGEGLIDLWNAIQGQPGLAIAIRRFSDAGERRRPEDRIVDLMIAAEQLFLTGERQELGFKLALRAACFLESDAVGRQKVFNVMSKGYNARSDVVHANQSKVRKLAPVLQGLSREVEFLVRRAILKALQQTNAWPLSSDQWNSLILNP